jgi:hypothetical protein
MEEALRPLQTIIPQGMALLRNIDWRDHNSALPSMIATHTGIDLAV